MPGGNCKFDAANAHHKFEKDQTALRAMFKHIFKENRHNSINFEQSHIMLDSMIDFSDLSTRQRQRAGDSSAFTGLKSRQGTADIGYATQEKKNSPGKIAGSVLTHRSNSIAAKPGESNYSPKKHHAVFGGMKFHSGLSNYNYTVSQRAPLSQSLGLSP